MCLLVPPAEMSSPCDAANTLRAFSPGGHNFRDGANGLEGREAERRRERGLAELAAEELCQKRSNKWKWLPLKAGIIFSL